MRDAPGYSVIIDPRYSRPIENDSTKCMHCQFIMQTKPNPSGGSPMMMVFTDNGENYRWSEMNFCRNCWGYICLKRTCNECKHYMKTIEEEEAAARHKLICEG